MKAGGRIITILLLVVAVAAKIELNEYSNLNINMKGKVKIDITSTIKKVTKISELTSTATVGKVYWDMEVEASELFSQELKTGVDKEDSDQWNIKTEDSLYQKTFVQRFDKETKTCYFWNARDPTDTEYYRKFPNFTQKACHSL